MDEKKLLITTDSFLPRWDGIARFLREIFPYLSQVYEITIIAPKFPGKKIYFNGVKIIYFPLSKITKKGVDYIPAKVDEEKLIKEIEKADIVWTQTMGPIGIKTINLAKKQKKPLISIMHSLDWELFSENFRYGKLLKFLLKFLIPYYYNKTDLVMVPSTAIGERCARIKTKKEVVNLGVSSDIFIPPTDKEQIKKQIGLQDKFVIGYVGRFGKEKDLKVLYDAFSILSEEFKNLSLLLVGGEREQLGFDSYTDVKVVSPVNNPELYFQAMDIYVLPSLTETTSLTTLEAMSCELPVVCTRVGKINEYIVHNENGLLFNEHSVEQLVLLLKKLIKAKKLKRKLGVNARKSVEKYSWNKTADKVKEILDRY